MQQVKTILCLVVLLQFSIHLLWAQQDDCEQILRTAFEEFNSGHFYGLSSILKPCIENGFTLEQRQRAYFLLTQAYLLTDDPTAADESYLKLLKANPEYVADESRDPIDIVYLSKKFTASPIFSLYGRLGTNVVLARVIHDIDLFDGLNGKDLKETYSVSPGYQLNVGIDWSITDHFSLSGGLQYMLTSYRHTTTGIFGRDVLEFHDKLNWVNIPIAAKYSLTSGRFKPFVYAGYSTNFLVSEKATVKYQNKNANQDEINGGETTVSMTSPILDLRYKRNLLNNAIVIGGGFRRKIGLNYWMIDFRYSFGLRNIVNIKNQYANNTDESKYENSLTPLMLYSQTEDYFRLDNLSVSIGYIYPLYKPRKAKHAKATSKSKEIQTQEDDAQQN